MLRSCPAPQRAQHAEHLPGRAVPLLRNAKRPSVRPAPEMRRPRVRATCIIARASDVNATGSSSATARASCAWSSGRREKNSASIRFRSASMPVAVAGFLRRRKSFPISFRVTPRRAQFGVRFQRRSQMSGFCGACKRRRFIRSARRIIAGFSIAVLRSLLLRTHTLAGLCLFIAPRAFAREVQFELIEILGCARSLR